MVGDYVMDVGAHTGVDTAAYLGQGFKVVAVEANPVLAEQLRTRFQDEVRSGQLTIVAAGVHHTSGTQDFFVSENDLLSSFIESRASVGGAAAQRVSVPVRSFRELLDEYGTPMYLKIDIEGLDTICLDALDIDSAPRYLSLEIDWEALLTVRRLEALGYRRFKLISGNTHRAVTPRRLLTMDAHRRGVVPPDHSSGPFGDDADGRWMRPAMMFSTLCLLLARRAWHGGALWHDLHATK